MTCAAAVAELTWCMGGSCRWVVSAMRISLEKGVPFCPVCGLPALAHTGVLRCALRAHIRGKLARPFRATPGRRGAEMRLAGPSRIDARAPNPGEIKEYGGRRKGMRPPSACAGFLGRAASSLAAGLSVIGLCLADRSIVSGVLILPSVFNG
mgnify:CR=1 FL=1